MRKVEALKALSIAIGVEAASLAEASTVVDVLNVIAAHFEGDDDAEFTGDAIANIAAAVEEFEPTITLEDKTITATTSEQTVTAGEGYDGIGTVTVNAVTADIDQNIAAENIKSGVTILGVLGTYTGGETT